MHKGNNISLSIEYFMKYLFYKTLIFYFKCSLTKYKKYLVKHSHTIQ